MSTVTNRDWHSHPAYISPDYKSSVLRGISQNLIRIDPEIAELTGPAFGHEVVSELDHDLTKNGRINGEPLGERIVVTGQVFNELGDPVANTLIEIWQANAAGRYVHKRDQHHAPLDPNFLGSGRCLTDADGRYKFYSIKPGAYPWRNHPNAWRPNHIHFSLFGGGLVTRLVTQMYFPGDPLLEFDPIFNATPEHARHRLVSQFSLEVTEEEFALGYIFNIVLRGINATPMED